DAGGTADEVARRVSARIRAPKVSRLEETPMAEPPAASGRRQKPLILVVEDDEDARMVLTELLRPRYDVDAVGDGETALKRAAEKEHFRALAQTDGLTGLPNFRSFHARLEEEVSRAHRYGHPLACAMVDLDGLKEINDKLGHAAGNRAIVALADAVREELRD